MDTPTQASIIPLNESPEPLRIDSLNTSDPVPTSIATERALKAQIATGDPGGYDSYYYQLVSGQEDQLRRDIAAKEDQAKADKMTKDVTNMVNSPLSSPDMAAKLQSYIQETSKPTDPKSVLEDKYAEDYMSMLNWPSVKNTDGFMAQAYRDIPLDVDRITKWSNSWKSFQEYAKTGLQDAQTALDNQAAFTFDPSKASQDPMGIINGYVPNLIKSFVNPLYDTTKLRGNVPGVSMFSGILLGSNLEEQAAALWKMPPDLRKQVYTDIMTRLRNDNLYSAVAFAKAVLGQSTSDVLLDNGLDALNLGISAQIGKQVGKAALKKAGFGRNTELLQDLKEAHKSLIKSGLADDTTLATKFEAGGDVPEAAVKKVASRLQSQVTGSGVTKVEKDALDAQFSLNRVDIADAKANPGRFGEAMGQWIEDNLNTLENNFKNTLTETLRVSRAPGLATEDAARAIFDNVKHQYPGLSNAFLDLGYNIIHEPISNTYHIPAAFGKPMGQGLWTDKNQLKQFMKNRDIPPTEYRIVPKGRGYYAEITVPLRETDDVARDLLIHNSRNEVRPEAVSQNTGLNGALNAYVGKARTPNDVLSREHIENRTVAAVNANNILEVAYEQSKALQDLSKGIKKYDEFGNPIEKSSRAMSAMKQYIPFKKNKEWDDFERVLKALRNELDANGEKGKFFDNPAEMDDFYQKLLKRRPSREEVEAYFSFKGLMELDRSMRNISVWRNKTRLGTETHRIYTIRNGEFGPEKVYSERFDGIRQNYLPGGDDIVYFVDKQGNEMSYKASAIPQIVRNGSKKKGVVGYSEMINKGEYHVVRIYDPETRPLREFIKSPDIKDNRIRYAVVPNVESIALSWNQVPRRGGGHFDYDYDHYIKQAKVRIERTGNAVTAWYEGDATVFPIGNRAMGKDIVDKMNEVRVLLKQGNETAAKTAFEGSIASGEFDFKTFKSWFEPSFLKGVEQPARLDLKEPFTVVSKDRKIVDLNKDLENRYAGIFKDGTKSGSDARQFDVSYTGERDTYELNTFKNVGTVKNPIYHYMPAEMVDPMPSTARALRRIIDSAFMDDYKNFAVEHWLREASPLLKAEEDMIRTSPFSTFFEATDKSAFKPDADPRQVSRLLTQRFMIKNFIGERSEISNKIYASAQDFADKIYTKVGPAAAAHISPSWMVGAITDPFQFVRAMVFHEKLGFWNVAQIPVQLMTYSNIYALGDISKAPAVTHAAFLHAWGRANSRPQILSKLDELAQGMNLPGASRYRPGEFKEAFLEMQKTGWSKVGPEYTLKDELLSPSVITNAGTRFLNAGDVFFKGGERGVRYGAWYMAMKELRDEFPNKVLSDADRRKLLARADFFAQNMTRASASTLHTGVLGLPGQFSAFALRQAEIFWGPRTDAYEKFKLYMWNGALFGYPAAVGVTGLPFGESIKQYALENGYVVGDNFIADLVMNGIPSALGAIITGQLDPKKGTWFDFGARFGNQTGYTPLKDVLYGDKSWWETLFGASYDTTKSVLGVFPPIWNYLMSFTREKDSQFPLTLDIFEDPFREISTVNNIANTYTAVNLGKWITRTGTIVDSDIPWARAAFMGMSGVRTVDMNNAYLKIGSLKEQKEVENAAFKYMRQRWVKSLAIQDSDPEAAHKMRQQGIAALKLGGMQEERIGPAIASVLRDADKNLINSIDAEFYLRKAPEQRSLLRKVLGIPNERDTRADAYTKTLQIEKGKQ